MKLEYNISKTEAKREAKFVAYGLIESALAAGMEFDRWTEKEAREIEKELHILADRLLRQSTGRR